MSKNMEDYLKTIYLLKKKRGYVRSIDLAETFGVSKPTICYRMKRLIKEGYVAKDENHFLNLTSEGTAAAEAVLKLNHTIMELLVSLGVEKEIAEEDACKMEHIISQQSLAALGLLLEGRLNKTF